jgi:Tol biopolymer transport system component
VPFSLAQMRTTGEPFQVAIGAFHPTIARDGSLVYVSPSPQRLEFCWLDRTGAVVEHVMEVGPASDEDSGVFELAPDGHRVAATLSTNADVWVYDFMRGSRLRLTSGPGLEVNATFTPDGRDIVYQAFPRRSSQRLDAWSLIRVPADGSGSPDTVARGGALTPAISADGKTLFYTHIINETAWTIESRPLGVSGSASALTDGHQITYSPRPSPDGRWLVYSVNDIVPNGHPQVVVQSLASGSKTVIGTGLWPKWDARGDRIYCVQRDDIMEVRIGKGDPPATEGAVKLFTRPKVELTMVFDWTPQFSVRGDRFLVLRPIDETRPTSIVLVENWLAEFKPAR